MLQRRVCDGQASVTAGHIHQIAVSRRQPHRIHPVGSDLHRQSRYQTQLAGPEAESGGLTAGPGDTLPHPTPVCVEHRAAGGAALISLSPPRGKTRLDRILRPVSDEGGHATRGHSRRPAGSKGRVLGEMAGEIANHPELFASPDGLKCYAGQAPGICRSGNLPRNRRPPGAHESHATGTRRAGLTTARARRRQRQALARWLPIVISSPAPPAGR